MGQVTVTINGRTYRLSCGEGEESRLLELAEHVRVRVEGLAAEFGQVGDERLIVMASLLIADELLEAREQLAIMLARVPQLAEAAEPDAADTPPAPKVAGLP